MQNCEITGILCIKECIKIKTIPFFVIFSASIQSSSGGSSPENNNYLRVSAAFGQRRLSDNVLTTPGHRKLTGMIGSTVSSPGSAPGTPLGVGFPIRRHSSAAFAANRRYSSNALLSPSTTIQVSHHLETDRSCTSHYLWLLNVH